MHTTDRLVARRRRLAAASIVGVVSVSIAAAGHALAGGGTPSVVALAVALLASGLIGMAVVGSRLTRRRALVGVVLDQVAFHALFAFFGPTAPSVGDGVTSLQAHAAHGGATSDLVSVVTGAPNAAAASGAAMIVAHLAAATFAYAMLRRGMAAVDAIMVSLATALFRLLAPAPIAARMPIPRHTVATGIAPLTSGPALLRLPDRRGPPAFAVC